ncbi:MAG TPA: hypothetical protein VL442_18490 [Mucilaginibacter sp.]|jgi:hypothetical protein|nr:hypothetical protein [Mucilaginibacter sp.]
MSQKIIEDVRKYVSELINVASENGFKGIGDWQISLVSNSDKRLLQEITNNPHST